MHTLILPLVTMLLGQLPGTSADHEHVHVALSHATSDQAVAQSARTGRIEGRIVVNRRPARRQARQYQASTTARPPQALPTIVYLQGSIPGAPARSGGTPSMAQRDTVFAPGFVAVALGGEVIFPNRDPFFHNVFSYSPAARFDLGRYPQGEAKEVVFDTPGVVKVFCEVHETMRSLILVTENRFYAEVGADGGFVLEGVPVGTWTIVGWDADQGSSEQRVTVRDGAVTRVEVSIG